MIEISNLSKSFVTASGTVDALRNINLTIRDGDIYGIIGMSGAGKSTLVRCINMLERPTEGNVRLDGVDLGSLSKKKMQEMRHHVTMIFQSFNLLMQRNCLQNIMLPLKLTHMPKDQAVKRATELLATVGMADKAKAYPAQLSGGQQQRIAIARALATDPKVLLCDEATSALDPQTTHSILQLLKKLNQELGITIVVITHQMQVVKEICQRVALMEAGRVVEQGWVYDIFAQPQQEITKDFVASADNSNQLSEVLAETSVRESLGQGARVFRFRFLHTSGGKALVSQISREFGIDLNIIHGNLEMIDGRFLGVLILLAQGDKQAVDDALAYARAQGVNVEELRG